MVSFCHRSSLCLSILISLHLGFSFRSYGALRGSPLLLKLIPAACIIAFAAWGVGPLMRFGRVLFLHVLILIFNSSLLKPAEQSPNCLEKILL